MNLFILLIIYIFISISINIIKPELFTSILSITWSITSILILYSGIKYSIKYHFLQLNIKNFLTALKSKSKNNIHPLSSLSISLAAKIGVGSLSGVALALYIGGAGSIFWMCVISLLVSINTYIECILGIKYRSKIKNKYIGGPSFYIKKCLNNKHLSILYSILIIITYSGLFLSIQSNTIVNVLTFFNIKPIITIIILITFVYLIIKKESQNIFLVDSILVPIMLITYLSLGLYVITTSNNTTKVILEMIKSAFNLKSFFSVFLIGMQRAIFISESGIGTSAISASSCDNDANKQGMLEILGIHTTTFIICFITFLIIATSNYHSINFGNISGIELVMYAFNYHFGSFGRILLTIITILFASSTIVSGYFFGENNLNIFTQNKTHINLFKIIVLIIIFISGYISPHILWNLTDFFIAILAIINISSILQINK